MPWHFITSDVGAMVVLEIHSDTFFIFSYKSVRIFIPDKKQISGAMNMSIIKPSPSQAKGSRIFKNINCRW